VTTSPSSRGARWVGHALLIPIWLGALALLALVIAHVVAFDDAHLFMLANAYVLWALLPAYAIAVAAVCFRAWPLAIVAGIVVVAHLVFVLPPLFRTVPVNAAAASAPRVRVVSVNLRFNNTDHAPTLDQLERFDADVIVLQEVTPAWWDAIRASNLAMSHPEVAEAIRDHPGGMAILSREPLRDVEVQEVQTWPIITATVVLAGRAVHLAGVHVPAPLQTFGRNQRAQREVTAIARSLPRPRLLAGDFNASPYNRWHEELLDLGLRDAHEAVGRPFAVTWRTRRFPVPPLLIDHVYADPPIVPVRAAEGRAFGSDHRPIVVDLAILPESP
jgi:endonuclease/exonuclease/phosphatase (EEP) superfamily protein YafD